jgi:uncharacterized protein YbaR (Trm112 family)
MQLALVDVLRCPQSHEETVLIAAIEHMGPGGIDRGTLACPICDARYRIDRGGIVFSPRERDRCWAAPAPGAPSPESVLRTAALLGLIEPGGLIVLGGAESAVAAPLHDQSDVACLLFNPPGHVTGWDSVTPVYAETLPLAPAVLRGAMLDARTGPTASDLVRTLRGGGRLVAPTATPLPPGVHELARDDDAWVAEREGDVVGASVILRRAPPPAPRG